MYVRNDQYIAAYNTTKESLSDSINSGIREIYESISIRSENVGNIYNSRQNILFGYKILAACDITERTKESDIRGMTLPVYDTIDDGKIVFMILGGESQK